MRTVLRLLIALNWTAAGCAFGGTVYGHRHLWSSICYQLAQEDLARDHPEAKFGTEAHYRLQEPLADEYRQRTEPIARSGDVGWWMMTVVGTATAIGLMAVFPKKSSPSPNGEIS